MVCIWCFTIKEEVDPKCVGEFEWIRKNTDGGVEIIKIVVGRGCPGNSDLGRDGLGRGRHKKTCCHVLCSTEDRTISYCLVGIFCSGRLSRWLSVDRLRVGRWRGWGGSLAYIQSMSDTVISNASFCLHKRGWDEGSLGGTRRQGKSHLGPLILTGKERGGSWAKSLIALICTAPLYLWQLMPVFFFLFVCSSVCFVHLWHRVSSWSIFT